MDQLYDNKKSSDIENFSRDQQNKSVEEYQLLMINALNNLVFKSYGGIVWRGEYSEVINYKVNDFVSFENSLYICIQDSIGNPTSNEEYWDVMIESPDNIQLRVSNNFIQWKYEYSETWNNLFNLNSLKGKDGDEVEIRKGDTHIQWKYLSEEEWTNLIAINDLIGPKGDDGDTGVGLDFIWEGTRLGVKREDETEYQYIDLKGEKGDIEENGWGAPVISMLNNPPENPTKGDRYIIGTGTGAWLGKDNYITFWDGSEWIFITPILGMAMFNNGSGSNFYVYIGGSWDLYELVTDDEKSSWSGKQDALGFTPENIDNKGVASGYCELDEGSKVPLNRLPSTLLTYKGVWDVENNNPELTSTDETKKGFVYNVSVAGTMFEIDWHLGDWAIYNDDGVLEKSDNSDDVVSVNGQQGVVVLNKNDIGLGNVDNTSDLNKPISTATQNALDLKWSLDGNTLGSKKTIGSIDNQDFGIITNNTERLTVLKDGNVGIGTTNPGDKLDVVDGLIKVSGTGAGFKIGGSILKNGANIYQLNTSSHFSTTGVFAVGTTPNSPYSIYVLEHNSTETGLQIKGFASKTSNFIEAVNSFSHKVFTISANGGAYFEGNVGIGTTNPEAKTHIYNNLADSSTALIINQHNLSSTGKIIDLQFNGNSVSWVDKYGVLLTNAGIRSTNQNLRVTTASSGLEINKISGTGNIALFQYNDATKMVITSDGRVGIGTTNPFATLHVNNSSGQASLIVESTGVTAGSRADMKFASQLGDVALRFNAESSNGTNYIQSGNYAFNGNKSLYFTGYSGNQGSTVMFNFATNLFTGNVGIGTTAPVSLLTLYGSNPRLSIANNVSNSGTIGIDFILNSNLTYERKNAIVVSANGTYGKGDMSFVLDSANDSNNYDVAADTKMIIKNSGNVGISTTNPSTKLQVVGEITKGLEKSIVQGVVFTQIADRTIGNTTTETSMFSTGVGSLTIPANTLVAGRTYRIKLKGYASGNNGDTSTIKVKLGNTELVSSTGTWQKLTDIGFTLEFDFTCRTTGATGTVAGNGYSLVSGGQGFSTVLMRALLAGTDTINTTVDQAIDLTYQWSAASADNKITITNASVEVLN